MSCRLDIWTFDEKLVRESVGELYEQKRTRKKETIKKYKGTWNYFFQVKTHS